VNSLALRIKSAEVFRPLYQPSRYKGAWGGRGSGKSHDRAGALIDDSLYERGLLSVCIREVQKSLKDSAKRLLEAKLAEFSLGEADGFKAFTDRIQTPGDGVIIFQGMQDHTAESIKSLEGFKRAWVEEAQTLSERSLSLLRPTIRAPGSELWFTWNPRRKQDAVDKLFRGEERPTGAQVVRANWNDNPWFPAELEQERLDCMRQQPDQYAHIWEGEYITVSEGAYFAKHLAQAKAEGRIGRIAADPLMHYRAFWDLGVSDHTAIWVAQFVGRQIFVVDYCEAQGQPLSYYVSWLKERGYGPRQALMILPHDGARRDAFSAVKFEDHLREAEFEVQTIRNQGKGAAMMRIEAARRLFPAIHFNEATTRAGLDALGWYHEKIDEQRGIGLGPEHDWASHGADAFGLMCVSHRFPDAHYAEEDDEEEERGRNSTTGY
jgi:phage terminase large subunit